MPWRKKTLTPFRRSNSAGASGSAGPSSNGAGGSISDASELFGGPNFDMEGNFNQFCNRFASGSVASTSVESADITATLSKQQFDRYLEHAFLSVAQANNIVMPWEKGIFKQIFGEEQLQPSLEIPWFPRTEAVDDTPDATVRELAAAVDRPSASGGPVYLHAISCISDLDHNAQQSKLKHSACNKWLSILTICLQASDVGRNIAALGLLDDHRSEVLEILEAVIGVRSYHTAICRANAVLKFLRDTLEIFPDTVMPFSGIGLAALPTVEGHWRSNGSLISPVSFSLCKVCHGF